MHIFLDWSSAIRQCLNDIWTLIRGSLMWLLRTPISAKYCWFGWWLGAWSTPSHHPTQLCDIYISGYKYTLISEWTRLFGPLRILDNLISVQCVIFCTTTSAFFLNIHLTHARSCSCRHSLSWVFFMPSSGVGLVSVPISDCFCLFSDTNIQVTNCRVTPWRL